SFVYDAAGRRMVKTVNGMTTYYVRDQQGEVLSEYRKSATSSGSPVWDRDYLYAAGRLVGGAENDNPHTTGGLTTCAWPNLTLNLALVDLSWQHIPDSDLLRYDIHRVDGNHEVVFPSGTTASYPGDSVSPNTTYTYSVVAIDQALHESPAS